jgi:uncharacterized protein
LGDRANTRSEATRLRLRIKVVPKAATDEVIGWAGEVLRVRVTAPPERGKANAAVLDMMSVALDLPRARLRLVAGTSSARKVIEVDGLTEMELRTRIEQVCRARKR